jgi:hypothetical protein
LSKETKLAPRGSSGLYHNSTPEKDRQITAIVTSGAERLIKRPDKCNIDDTKTVIKRTEAYVKECAQISKLPSVKGLCGALGISSRTFYNWINNHPKHPTTEYLELTKDIFADLLEEAGLNNAVNNISSIFILKSQHQYQETSNISLQAVPYEPLGEPKTLTEIQALIDDDIVED